MSAFYADRRGVILVTTLWILALLTLLALGIGIRAGVGIKLVSFFLNSSKAYYLAEAGLRKTVMLIERDENKKVDTLNEKWACGFDFDDEEYILKDIPLGEGTFTVSYEFGGAAGGGTVYLYGAQDEEGKLNINKLEFEMLLRLPDFTSEVADSIIDWRDEDEVGRLEGAEAPYYDELEQPYECKNGPFSVPEELLLVKGVTEEIYEGIRDIITVYPYDGDGRVNINTASQSVLTVIIGDEFEDLPGKIVAFRNGDDEEPGTQDDRVFQDTESIITQLKSPLASGGLDAGEIARINDLVINKKIFKVSSNTFRIISRGVAGDGRARKTIEAVVKRTDKETEMLDYHEN